MSATNMGDQEWKILEKSLQLDRDGVLHWKEFKLIFERHKPAFVKTSKPKPPPAKVDAADHPMLWAVFEAVTDWLDGQKDRRAVEVSTK